MLSGKGQYRIAGFDRGEQLVDTNSGLVCLCLHDLEGIGQVVSLGDEVAEAGPGQLFELLSGIGPGIRQLDDGLTQLGGRDRRRNTLCSHCCECAGDIIE